MRINDGGMVRDRHRDFRVVDIMMLMIFREISN